MKESLDLPGLIPTPKRISLLGGNAELSEDVRLVTSDVLPLQRKAMRGILTGAGVRVVANKKKFIIEACVEGAGNFDLSDVPEFARQEYYELEVHDNRVFIRTAGQSGALHGTQTLANIYRAASAGSEIPNLIIRDWPSMPYRGIFVENKWGPDRMALCDWYLVIDRMSALKMNCLGVGLYGCWGSCRYEGQPTEFLMVPVPDHPELVTGKKLRWYSPDEGEWFDESYLPVMFEEDLLGEVVAYGREKGVKIIPFVNSLGHNTMIPRLLPEISAKDKDGVPQGIGYCLCNPKTREFIEAFYGSIIERYYADGLEFFHVELDEVWPDYGDPDDPTRQLNPWCECADCQKIEREESLQDYITWLVTMLTGKGVERVVMWNDQLTRHMDALDGSFVKKLKQAGVADRLVLHWWWYSNDALNDKTRVAIGKEVGLPGWVAPMTCYFNWERFDVRLKNIEMMMRMAHDEGAEGAVSYAVHDPGWADHEALLASYAWNYEAVSSLDEQLAAWALGRFGAHAEQYCGALKALHDAAGNYAALNHCYYYRYSYCKGDAAFPREYPGEALSAMGDDAGDQLEQAAAAAREAAAGFAALAAAEEVSDDEQDCVKSLLGEAARITGLATVFAYLLSVRSAAESGSVDAQLSAAIVEVRCGLVDAMATVEKNKPDWVVPASLQALSVLLEFLDQLAGDLKEVGSGSRSPGDIRWTQCVTA